MRILVVDDEVLKLQLYRLEFEDEGYEVSTARTAEEALRLFTDADFAVVTLDITMEEPKEGLDLLRKMKERKPQVSVLMLSAYDYTDDFKCWAADGYIVKSSDLTELKAKVRELMSG